jgi:hypothetical protein
MTPQLMSLLGGLVVVCILMIFLPWLHTFCLFGAMINVLSRTTPSENKDQKIDEQLRVLLEALSHAALGYGLSILVLPYCLYRAANPSKEWSNFIEDISVSLGKFQRTIQSQT